MAQIDAGEPASYAKVVWPQDRHQVEQQQVNHLNIDCVDNQRAGIRLPKAVHFRPCQYRLEQDQLQVYCNCARPLR